MKNKGHGKQEVRVLRSQIVGWLASCIWETDRIIHGVREKVLSHVSKSLG